MIKQAIHIPVMYREVIEHLNLRPGCTIVDGTVGTGGHAEELLKKMSTGRLIGIDKDTDSLSIAQERLKQYEGHFQLMKGDFRDVDHVMSECGVEKVDGMIFDLGISSYQLGDSQRGFSFMREGPLDMRMDKASYISAYDLINSLSENELSGILRTFGQERWSNRIAKYLVRERSASPISSTRQLSDIVSRAVPHHRNASKIHPATRTFMAFRIAVNRELEALELALDKSIQMLKKSGRIVVISFHSLEDKIVKEKFRMFSKEKILRLITKKPLRATQEEIHENARSRSAKMRVAERV
ncbi:16S rRNA (cytosine(1402)-N(4))-methyltransferase RsmH [Candidatus Omnitrophota bacterium]